MDFSEEDDFATLLKRFRKRKRLTQTGLARKLEMHRETVGAWERNLYRPANATIISNIADVLGLSFDEKNQLLRAADYPEEYSPSEGRKVNTIGEHQSVIVDASHVPSLIWNVPYHCNPFFTGREDILERLHDTLVAGKAVALVQAISGLGGIGKTETVVEYAHRHKDDYQAILWVGAETHESLVSDFVKIAALLELSERDSQDEALIIEAVKKWLRTHGSWLLIFDNVEDLPILQEFIPSNYRGHIVLTTRLQATETAAQFIELATMTENEGALFLLRRARLIASDTLLDKISNIDHTSAKTISHLVDGLPLALDQAGAYIRKTRCGVSRYLALYQKFRTKLLEQRESSITTHPEPVTTTFALSFNKVETANPAAADLLRLSAFLHPDSIPEDIFTEGSSVLDIPLRSVTQGPLEFEECIEQLLKFSLVRREPDSHTLYIHRLVQAVLRDGMGEQTQCLWAERTVRAVNQALPEVGASTWFQWQWYFPQAQVCVGLIEQYNFTFQTAARLLDQTGCYLRERAQYAEAEPLLLRALSIREEKLGTEHPETAQSLNDLAELYDIQGKYDQAEQLYLRALETRKQKLGMEHPDTAQSLNNLASLYWNQDQRYELQTELLTQALAIWEKALGPEHSDKIRCLNNLGVLYQSQGQYVEAEDILKRVLILWEKTLGPEHPETATTLNNLAWNYNRQDKYEQAEVHYQRALAIREKVLGAQHPDTAIIINNLAWNYDKQGNYEQTEALYQRALAIWEKVFDPEHLDIGRCLNNLGELYTRLGKFDQAESYLTRALSIRRHILGSDHPEVITTQKNLEKLYADRS